MSTYRVTLQSVASAYYELEAESEEDAVDKAFDSPPQICAQCSGWGKREGEPSIELGDVWDVPEWAGAVEVIEP